MIPFFNIGYFVDLCYNIAIKLPNLLKEVRGISIWSRMSLTRIRKLTSQANKGGLVIIKLNVKTTLLALTLTLVSSSSVFAASYKVKSGDTLYKVSKDYNTSTKSIMKNNKLSSDVIHSGQVLDVPTNTYNVVDRDTLFFIAKKYSISVQQIRVANNKWDDVIHPGDVINIPTTTDNGQAPPQNASTVVNYSNSDVDLLARLITAEASGESPDAMLAVGAVVINRVQSLQYPGKISSVINEVSDGHYQFTPVKNGMIDKVATKTATDAAYNALKGNDPTNGALFFFDNTVTNEWLTSKPVAATLGKLIFAY